MGKVIHMMHQSISLDISKKMDVWFEPGRIVAMKFNSYATFKVNVDGHTGIQEPVLEISSANTNVKKYIDICDGLISLHSSPFLILARAVEVVEENKIKRVMFSFYEREALRKVKT